jgi:hypothetical protein
MRHASLRHIPWLAAILLPLDGCYLPPATPDYGYAQSAYAQSAYGQSAYGQPVYEQQGYGQPAYAQPDNVQPGYPPGGYDPYAGDPGFSYNNGAPMIMESGVPTPLVFFGGQWGFYDHDRHWHHAPDHVSHDLDAQRGGGHFYPNAGPGPSFHDGHPVGGAPYHGQPHGYPQGATPAAAPAPHSAQPQPQPHPQDQQRHCEPHQRC